ncbi:MAG: hypothetical protein IH624_04100 [Phycisphaerae bacterium]|nr:hypothetical protein [Phycisphaerae bacterium]
MQCRRCEFENMPGQTACFQCGSLLSAESMDIKVEPPRMALWKKPWRWFMRQVRATRIIPHPKAGWRVPGWCHAFGIGLLGVLLSVVPGLAHVVRKRFRSVGLYLALWGAFVFGLFFFYGGFWGMVFLGLAVAMHAWIAVHAGLLEEVSALRYRLLALALIAVVLAVLYREVGRWVLQDITGGHVTHPVAFHRVREGDFVLVRRSLACEGHLTRGSLVLAPMAAVYGQYSRGARGVIAQIVALPGETLTVEEVPGGGACFAIGGERLEIDRYPVPEWLTMKGLSVTVPKDHFFLSTAFRTRGAYGAADVARACVVPAAGIEAKAFMRWLPVWRRGFVREVE